MKDPYNYLPYLEQIDIPIIREDLAPYLAHKVQGEFTIEDYYNLPNEHRAELIDGVIYDMSSPTSTHQIINLQLCIKFDQYIKSKKGKCIPLISPLDVQLDCNNKTILQPDVLIVCDKNKINNRVICGAPDLVVEVLSPSTRNKDIKIKTNKYRNAGVKEYWIVDPINKQVRIHEFDKDKSSALYTFEDKIPVGIWNGECVVDFKEINEYISFLEE